ncbi:MAG: hypothetical protein ACREIT_06485, partial [Tepidisphaeraceae bacterium]
MTMRIGFVDKSLENYHANVFHGLITNDLKDRGFVVAGCTALDEAGGREWASKNGVAYHAAPERLNEQVDCFMVLAPGDPSVHLELCQRVFLFGKPTYVDKTFAPDLATARRIFELADRHRVSVQTTSALRYTDVQRHVAKLGGGGAGRVRHMVAWGGGRSFAEYAIHPVELVVSCMGPGA